MSYETIDEMLGLPPFEDADTLVGKSQYAYFQETLTELIDDSFIPTPTTWAEENRYLPSTTTENYGFFDSTKIKYIAKILDHVHPDDPTTHISVIKSVQSGLTVSLGENAMGFFTHYRLGSVAFFTSTKGITKARSNQSLDVMIDNCGLAKLIKPMSNRTNRKSADTTFSKEFAGGIRWLMTSYGSIADMKSNTFNLIIKDEWDEAKKELKGQGDTSGIIEGRTMAVRLYKILAISTPSSMDSSRIYKDFIAGDQQRYFVPCPHCGKKQTMKLKFKDDDNGLTFSMRKNPETGVRELDETSVRYICKHCKKSFYEFDKNEAIEHGEWRATWQETEHRPKSPLHKSFHVPGILSPFLAWPRICQQFINCRFGKDLLAFKDFTINYLGEPWAKVKAAGSWEAVKKRAEDYCMGEVPKGGLVLVGGCDVQKDRLELKIIAVGVDLEKWVVDYQVFYGNPADIKDKCWIALNEYAYGKTFKVEGAEQGISLIAIDSGYNPREAREDKDWESKSKVVFDFVSHRTNKFIAIKGTGECNRAYDLIKECRAAHGLLKKRYDVATPMIKEMLMNTKDLLGGPNAIHFPKYKMFGKKKVKVPDEFFMQYMSERFQELEPGKMGWKKTRERNEVWDTAVYCVAAIYFLNLQVWGEEIWQDYAKNLRERANSK